MSFKVLVTDVRHGDIKREEKMFRCIGAEVYASLCNTEEEVIQQGSDFDALLVSYTPIGAKVFSRLKNVKVVVKYGVGYDNIDVEVATKTGVIVCNVRHHCIEEVSTHAVGLLLAAIRRLCYFNKEVRRGIWRENPAVFNIARIKGKSLGIVGLGNIGKRFTEKMTIFDPRILIYDPYLDRNEIEKRGYFAVDTLNQLFYESNYVSIHCSLKEETRGMISENVLSQARNLILVNTARGPIVDHQALAKAIKEGRILFYATDVMPNEPPPPDDEAQKFLLNDERVIITPHCAWYSRESEEELITEAVDQVISVLTGKIPRNIVNPEVLKKVRF